MRALRDVDDSCFGDILDPNYCSVVENFSRKYRALGISITPKVHTVEKHIVQFIQMAECSLGQYSDQLIEACHSEFEHVFKRFFIKNEDNASFPQKLKSAVNAFNASHV